MKTKSKNWKTALVFTLTSAMLLSFSGIGLAEQKPPEETAKQTVQKFFKLLENGKYSEAADLASDSRFADKQKQIEKYEKYSKKMDFPNIKVLSAKAESDSKVNVTVEELDSGKTFVEDVSVIKDGQNWKVVLSNDEAATTKEISSNFIAAGAVDFYEIFGVTHGTVLYTDDSFDVTNTNNIVTIHGWQNDGGITNHVASNKYQVVEDVLIGGYRPWGVEHIETSDSDPNNSATWYGHTFSGIPLGSDYHIKITGNSSQGYGSDGAGNVYQ